MVYPDKAVEVLYPYTMPGRANDEFPQVLSRTAPFAQLEIHETNLVDITRLGIA